jgi:hypothetical protein
MTARGPVPISKAKPRLSDLCAKAYYRNEYTILMRRGVPWAVIAPLGALESILKSKQ